MDFAAEELGRPAEAGGVAPAVGTVPSVEEAESDNGRGALRWLGTPRAL
ncbi:hypothetical protein ACIA8E_32650 [Streptomyces sp. NPDC051664]